MKRKKWLMLGLSMLLIFVLSVSAVGCRPKTKGYAFLEEDLSVPIDANIDPDTSGEITIGIMAQSSEEIILSKLIADFNLEYPNIKVNIEKISGNYISMLLTHIPAKTMPDLYWTDPTYQSIYLEAQLPFNLTNYIDQSGLNMDEYIPQATVPCKAGDTDYYVTMPRDYSHLCMYYNRAILNEVGLKDPSNDWTWSDFLTYANKIAKESEINHGFPVLDGQLTWEAIFCTFLFSYGGNVIDEDGNVVLADGIESGDNPCLKMLNDLVKLGDEGILTRDRSVSSGASFQAKKSAFYMHSRPVLTNMYEILGQDLGVVAFPAIGNDPQAVGGPTGYSIYRGSDKKDLAWAFLKYMMSNAGQEVLSTSGNILPCKTSVLQAENATWKQYPEGTNIDHDAYIAHADRGTFINFLNYMVPGSQEDGLGYLRSMIDAVMLDRREPKGEVIACAEKFELVQKSRS